MLLHVLSPEPNCLSLGLTAFCFWKSSFGMMGKESPAQLSNMCALWWAGVPWFTCDNLAGAAASMWNDKWKWLVKPDFKMSTRVTSRDVNGNDEYIRGFVWIWWGVTIGIKEGKGCSQKLTPLHIHPGRMVYSRVWVFQPYWDCNDIQPWLSCGF